MAQTEAKEQKNGIPDGISVQGVNALMGTTDLPADHFMTFASDGSGLTKIGLKSSPGDTPCTVERVIDIDITVENLVADNVVAGNYHKQHKA